MVFILWNAIILWLLYTGATDHEVGNDAAGAGMGRGFREIFATVSAIGIAVLALPPIIVQHRGVRIAFIGLLAIASCLTPMRFSSSSSFNRRSSPSSSPAYSFFQR